MDNLPTDPRNFNAVNEFPGPRNDPPALERHLPAEKFSLYWKAQTRRSWPPEGLLPMMRKPWKRLLLAALPLLLVACSTTLPATGPIPSRTYDLTLGKDARGWSRSALVHIPPGLGKDPLPLLVVLHGAFSTGEAMEKETGFSRLADRDRFIVAYPQGIGLFGWLQHWNAGYCCGRAEAENWDDAGTVLRLIDRLEGRLPVDPARIYLVGMSNGGMLAYRLAAGHPERFAALAVMAGAIGSSEQGKVHYQLPPPARPLPVLILHGRADRHIPFAGGVSPRKGGGRSYSSVAAAVDFWRRADGCAEAPSRVTGTPESIEEITWDGCRAGSAVTRIALPGWGHVWPGQAATANLPAGDPLTGFAAATRCWAFLRRFRRPARREVP